MECSTPKCVALQSQEGSITAQYILAGKHVNSSMATKYLGNEITYDGVTVEGNLENLDHAIWKSHTRRAAGLHDGKTTSATMLRE